MQNINQIVISPPCAKVNEFSKTYYCNQIPNTCISIPKQPKKISLYISLLSVIKVESLEAGSLFIYVLRTMLWFI